MLSADKFQIVDPVSLHFPQFVDDLKTFDTSGKSPAQQYHRENHTKPGRRNPPRAFLLKHFSSEGGGKRVDETTSLAVRCQLCSRTIGKELRDADAKFFAQRYCLGRNAVRAVSQ